MTTLLGRDVTDVKDQPQTTPTPEWLAQIKRQRQKVRVVGFMGETRNPAKVMLKICGPAAQMAARGDLDVAEMAAATDYARDYELSNWTPRVTASYEERIPSNGTGARDMMDVRIHHGQLLREADAILGVRGIKLVRAALGLPKPTGAFGEIIGTYYRGKSKAGRRAYALGMLQGYLMRLAEHYGYASG